MKKVFLTFSLSVCALILFACQSQEKEMTLLDDISSISISKSYGYGGINENFFVTIDKSELISKLEDVLNGAEGKKQKIDVSKEKPDYDILVNYKSRETHGLHLVLGDTGEKSRVMYVGHEQNGFDISPEGTEVLKKLMDKQ
ncbi:hypothetical protein CSV80_11305 [Sporosarcina sp. P12(2017)]|uniref:hypothetical protein n=1 Tax=unclassified Sporosarcina TaxID=2647733 RepID=UPI000C164349|nr:MULTISPECIES: hypothetical protein [unclassified Sporosarcina]PIC57047.1 hypothetical protein CSV81_11705 [Sporosarcina sp. P10]PIC60430.1 hypothetical protein CSV80_11305 [Sporosarcina sp. P12(2017)]